MIECLKMHKENFDYCLGEIIRESEEKDKEIERLNNIIKEVREKLCKYGLVDKEGNFNAYLDTIELKELLEILDKENKE